ncbi:hypothetical protein OOU_Y34scaffold00418g1 [Pyricularia oryzae Y34]|uniref:Uncharacterized protein n=2 Tax=Pyricularia oryzae TaxID=318829 RepID=A0AA97P1W3_PYRO3|nr:hypothetical protein OOU_Y34scaffold00418g1 [Pyricularia oryzae Y34]
MVETTNYVRNQELAVRKWAGPQNGHPPEQRPRN